MPIYNRNDERVPCSRAFPTTLAGPGLTTWGRGERGRPAREGNLFDEEEGEEEAWGRGNEGGGRERGERGEGEVVAVVMVGERKMEEEKEVEKVEEECRSVQGEVNTREETLRGGGSE